MGEPPGDGETPALDFLQPSTKPGSLGRLGHYEVLEVLGQGGFGIVLKAFDEKLHRVVAIKVMAPHLAATSPARKRFLREARAAAAVRHENVVAIHAVEEQPIPYLVMEYIAGQTLQQKLDRNGPLDVTEVLRIGQQIASGLAAAHAQGLIHRDIKPANILLENGVEQRVKITDFGLARAADDASLTQSGVIAGTPLYMAPEQAQGEAIDHAGRPVQPRQRPVRDVQRPAAVPRRDHAGASSSASPRTRRGRSGRSSRRCRTGCARSSPGCTPRSRTTASPRRRKWPTCWGDTRRSSHSPMPRGPSPCRARLPRRSRIRSSGKAPPPSTGRSAAGGDSAGSAVAACGIALLAVAGTLWQTRRDERLRKPGRSTPALAVSPFDENQAREHQEAWAKHLGATSRSHQLHRLGTPADPAGGVPHGVLGRRRSSVC